jgi:hypothetical protein
MKHVRGDLFKSISSSYSIWPFHDENLSNYITYYTGSRRLKLNEVCMYLYDHPHPDKTFIVALFNDAIGIVSLNGLIRI